MPRPQAAATPIALELQAGLLELRPGGSVGGGAQINAGLTKQIVAKGDADRMDVVRDAEEDASLGPGREARRDDLIVPARGLQQGFDRLKANLIRWRAEEEADRAALDLDEVRYAGAAQVVGKDRLEPAGLSAGADELHVD